MAQLNFNVNEVPESDFEPIEPGEYTCQIIQSEMKDNNAGTGQYLELRVQVLDEPYQGRLIFERLNLIHTNEKAVAIANRTLRDICNAIGVMEIEDSEELHGKEFLARVVIGEARGDYPAQNEVKKYLPV